MWNDATRLDEVRFSQLVFAAKEAFDTKTEYYEQALNGLRDWLQLVEAPSLDEWNNRIDLMRLAINLPAITELGYMPYLPNPQGERWSRQFPKHLTNHWSELRTEPFQLVAYSSTTPEWRVSRFGINLPLIPTGNPYMTSVGSGDLCVTERINVATNHPGFRGYLAVYPQHMQSVLAYAPDRSPKDIEEHQRRHRIHTFVGVIFCDIAAKPLMESIYGTEPGDLRMDLYAGPPQETNRLYPLTQPPLNSSVSFARNLGTNAVFAFYGDRWTLSCAATPLFWSKSHRPQALRVLAMGSAISLALAGLVFVQVRARTHAEAFARELEQSRTLLRQADEHRARLSRNLHDGTMQSLYVIGMRLQHSRSIPQLPPAADTSLSEALADIDTVIKDLRQHLESQREGLAPTSLGQALQELAQRWQRSSTTRIELRLDELNLRQVPARMSLELIAIVQEAVSNSLRHSRASRVVIEAAIADAELRLSVEDDGLGFDPSGISTGQGLRNQQSRASMLGGSCEVISKPGGPTKVEVRVRFT